MPEPDPTPDTDPDTPIPDAPADLAEPDKDDEPLRDTGMRALKAERARAAAATKRAEAAEAKLKEADDATKSEAEKLAERATEATKRAEAAEHRVLVMEVAAEKGLTPAQAKRLTGESREDLEADAEDLLASFRPAAPDEEQDDEEKPPGRPREALRPGAVRDGKAPVDIDKVVEQVPRNTFRI